MRDRERVRRTSIRTRGRQFEDDVDGVDGFDPNAIGEEEESERRDDDGDGDGDGDGFDVDDGDVDDGEDEDDDVGAKFARSMYEDDVLKEEEDGEDDDGEDEEDWGGAVGDSDARASFGDIDVVAGQEELDDVERDVPVEKSRHFVDSAGELSGRALYVCQLNWWLRVKKMQTYPPSKKEIAEMVDRTGVTFEKIQAWYDDQCEAFSMMSIAEQAAYETECAKKQAKLEELVADDFQERSGTHFIEEDIFYDEADLMHEADMDEEPLTLAMEKLEEALKEEEEENADEDEEEGGLDETQIARIYQDGSESSPFLINPKKATESGKWSIDAVVESSEDSDDGWLGSGGWDALPQHNAVSAVDGGSLAYVGVLNDEIGSGATPWLRDRPLNAKGLVPPKETPAEDIDRDPQRHLGQLTRIMHTVLEIGQELEGTVVAMDLYHGALVDCGTEIDALLPICEADWIELRNHINIGTKLTVRVTAIRQKWWRFRYPLEVKPTRQDLSLMIKRHPHTAGSPINMYAGETVEEACADAGRTVRDVTGTSESSKRKQYTIEDVKKMIASSDRQDRKITEYERDLLEAGVDDEKTNIKFTQTLEARLTGAREDDEEEFDEEANELFSDKVVSLKSEDIEDEDEDIEVLINDEVSIDMRGGSAKIRDEAVIDDISDDDDDLLADFDDDDDDDDVPSARSYAR